MRKSLSACHVYDSHIDNSSLLPDWHVNLFLAVSDYVTTQSMQCEHLCKDGQ